MLQSSRLQLLSHFSPVRLLATPWTAAYQAPPSMGFSRHVLQSHCFRFTALVPYTISESFTHPEDCESTKSQLTSENGLLESKARSEGNINKKSDGAVHKHLIVSHSPTTE